MTSDLLPDGGALTSRGGPPEIGAIWHNSFHEQLTKNAGPIEDALAATAPVLSGAELVKMREAGLQQAGLVTSIREAIQVSRRIGPRQLGPGCARGIASSGWG